MTFCIVCNSELNSSNWTECSKNNYVNKCNICLKAEKLEWGRNWRNKNRDKLNKRSAKYKSDLRISNPIKARAKEAYGDCRKRAIKHGWDFDLTSKYIEDLFKSNTNCPYFGWNLTYSVGKAKTLASIDRISSSKGYTKDNVQVISYMANLMKSNATNEELIIFAKGILQKLNKGDIE